MPKILLVEDNEMNRDMLERRLSRQGFEVVLAMDGQQAVDVALSLSPDVILMDVSLPVFDGLEATRILRTSEQARNIPIIALTAHAMASDKERCLEAGCDDYDTKPVDFQRLLKKIHSWLLGRQRPTMEEVTAVEVTTEQQLSIPS